jgi:hypothetical protein
VIDVNYFFRQKQLTTARMLSGLGLLEYTFSICTYLFTDHPPPVQRLGVQRRGGASPAATPSWAVHGTEGNTSVGDGSSGPDITNLSCNWDCISM